DLGEDLGQVLAVIERIVCRAAIANRDVQVAVRPEADRAAVMVPEGLGDAEEFLLRRGIGLVRIVLSDAEAANDIRQGRLLARVEDEELAIFLVAWMEGEAEEPFFILLVVVDDPILKIEEDFRLRRLLVVGEDVNYAVLRG